MSDPEFDALSLALDVLQEKWALHVIEALRTSPSGFNELSRRLGVNPSTLSERLNRLEALRMVQKTTFATQPPRASIELLPAGIAFEVVLSALYRWGEVNMPLSAEDRNRTEIIDVLEGKWAMRVARALLEGPRRFNDLARALGGVNPTTLGQRLDKLERLGLLVKTTLSVLPPASSVELTERGYALKSVFEALEAWALEHVRP